MTSRMIEPPARAQVCFHLVPRLCWRCPLTFHVEIAGISWLADEDRPVGLRLGTLSAVARPRDERSELAMAGRVGRWPGLRTGSPRLEQPSDSAELLPSCFTR
jgi:hypothetical protein